MKNFSKYFILGILLTAPLMMSLQAFAGTPGSGTMQACCGNTTCNAVAGGTNPVYCAAQCKLNCTTNSPLWQYCVGFCDGMPIAYPNPM